MPDFNLPEDARILDNRQPFALALGQIPILARHKDYELEVREDLLPQPINAARRETVATAESFCLYLRKHGSERAAVYVQTDWLTGHPASTLFARGFIDDGDRNNTSWRSHQLQLRPRTTQIFDEWRSLDDQDISQTDLCLFLDKHLSQIVRPTSAPNAPSAAEVMTFSANLSDVKKVEFKKSVRLDNGRTQLSYNEEGEAGAVTIPRDFFIQVQPIAGRPQTYVLPVSMRYRIVDMTRLIFTLSIRGLQELIDQLREEITEEIRMGLDGPLEWPIYIS